MRALVFNSAYLTADYKDTDWWPVMNQSQSQSMLFDSMPASGSVVIDDGSSYVPSGNVPVTPSGDSSQREPQQSDYDGIYTKEELARMIRDKENDIRDLDLQVRKAQLELKMMKDAMEDGTLYAKKDGVVTVVGDPADPPSDGSPFMTVAGGTGLTVRGSISELMLDTVRPGTHVTLMSWETGEMFEGEVQSVDVYPSSDSYYSGNPNVSYYDFYIYSEDAPSLPPYSGLQITFAPIDSSTSPKIILENAFIRSDAGGSYVMKAEDGKLKKQYVKTGRSYYGYSTEIKEGITEEDYITFPYGDGEKEGTAAEIAETPEVFYQ
jgi:hypothetical protein